MSQALDAITKQGAHSEIGASSMKRWANCPGSVRLSRGIPNRGSSYADEGTNAHTVAASLLEGKGWPDEIPYDSEMADAVRVYSDYIASIIGAEGWAGNIFIEHRFDLSRVFPGLFGTADCVIYSAPAKTLHVIDYKHGQGYAVEVAEADGTPNPQLMYYGLGAQVTMPYSVETVILTIVQPRCAHPSGPIRSLAVAVEAVYDFAFHVAEMATRTQKHDAPLVPGEWCKSTFCPAAGVCPKLHAVAQEVAKREFASHLSYDPQSLSDTLEKLDAVEAWTKGVRAFAYAELEHGREIPGWKLVQKRPTRRWRSETEAAERLAAATPSTLELFDRSLKSPAQIEKLLGKDKKPLVAELVTSESSGFALAPADDPRPAAKMTPADAFAPIPETEIRNIEKMENQ